SGAIAIGEAFRLIRDGRSTLMLAGGVEAPLAPLTFGSFALIKAMSTADDDPGRASRPFDARRDGFVMGEGAAMLVLESLGHPLGASGAIETAIVALAIARGWLPGTTNLVQADADNSLNLIGPTGLRQQPRVAINTAFGFGGINAALVLMVA